MCQYGKHPDLQQLILKKCINKWVEYIDSRFEILIKTKSNYNCKKKYPCSHQFAKGLYMVW